MIHTCLWTRWLLEEDGERKAFFLTFYWFFMNCISRTPVPLIFPSSLLPALHPSNSPYIGKKNLIVEAVVCHSVSKVYPFVHTSSFIAMTHLFGKRLLASVTLSGLAPHWASTLGYPVPTLCHGNPKVLDL